MKKRKQVENVAQKYHVMAALPNIGVDKNGAPFLAAIRPTYRRLAVVVRKRRSQTHLF